MFENRSYKRTFYSAPQSVTSLVAAILEPAVAVLSFLAVSKWFDEPIVRSDLTLCLLVLALTFPGKNRFKDSLLSAGVDLFTSWISLLAILALCAYATSSFGFFDPDVLLWWAVLTPLLQWLAVWTGQQLSQRLARMPHNRRGAIVIGAGALGVKVAKALLEGREQGVDFLGYFDDRTDERVHSEAMPQRLGPLKDAAPYIHAHAVHEVYITLPLGSQPRIVELLEQVQGTTASIFFVPDVFGISIIQGRLQDMNGVPVVGICETPFTGTNELVKRASDIVLASIILVLISQVFDPLKVADRHPARIGIHIGNDHNAALTQDGVGLRRGGAVGRFGDERGADARGIVAGELIFERCRH
jgi:putative colanic acid biosynthesis UDP-glucose lipid carrier transferase